MIKHKNLIELSRYQRKLNQQQPKHQAGLGSRQYPVTSIAEWKAGKEGLSVPQTQKNPLHTQLNRVRHLLMIAIPWLGLGSMRVQVEAYEPARDFLQDEDMNDGLSLFEHLYIDTALQESSTTDNPPIFIPDYLSFIPTLRTNRGLIQRIVRLREMFIIQSARLNISNMSIGIRADDPAEYEHEIGILLQLLDRSDQYLPRTIQR